MRRRDFVAGLGLAAALPLSVRAEQGATPIVGFLHSGSPGPNAHLVKAFLAGLGEAGFEDGRNVRIEYRWAEGQYDRLAALATELVGHGAAVLATSGGSVAAIEARKVAASIPLIFVIGSDPVRAGLVTSLSSAGRQCNRRHAHHKRA
jgi:putative ABC transport system substrate-binding protein